jgi:hypothetical protein
MPDQLFVPARQHALAIHHHALVVAGLDRRPRRRARELRPAGRIRVLLEVLLEGAQIFKRARSGFRKRLFQVRLFLPLAQADTPERRERHQPSQGFGLRMASAISDARARAVCM